MSIIKSALRGVGVVFFALASSTLQAQTLGVDSICVTLEKAGQLKKAVKKYDMTAIKYLKVNGFVSGKDLDILNEMPNLKNLYFEDAVYFKTSNDYWRKESMAIIIPVLEELQLDKLHLFPYAEDKKGEKSMVCLEYQRHVKELALNYYSEFSCDFRGNKKLIIYPEDARNIVGDASRISVACSYIQVFDRKYINTGSVDTKKSSMKAMAKKRGPKAAPQPTMAMPGRMIASKATVGNARVDVIELIEEGRKSFYVNEFNGDPNILSNIAFMGKEAFHYIHGSKYSHAIDLAQSDGQLKLSDDVTVIPVDCFEGQSNLKSVIAPSVKRIEYGAFRGCKNFEELETPAVEYIGERVFYETQITKLVLPPSLQYISGKAFKDSKIQEIEFQGQYPPSVEGEVEIPEDIILIVPSGCKENYNRGMFAKLEKREVGEKMFELVVNSSVAGTLSSQITDENALSIESLTISGRLYDTDFESIYKCKNLKMLDLSNCFTVKSPATVKKEMEAERRSRESSAYMLSAFFHMLGDYTFSESAISADTYLKYEEAVDKMLDQALESSGEDINIPNDACLMPDIKGFKRLKKIAYPRWLKDIHIDAPETVEEIIFPENLKSVSGGSNTSIRTLILPDSISLISSNSFNNCRKLETIKLGNTKITFIDDSFRDCPNLREVDLYGAPITRIDSDITDAVVGLHRNYYQSFINCPNIKTVRFSDCLNSIGSYTFSETKERVGLGTYFSNHRGAKDLIGYFYTPTKPECDFVPFYSKFKEIHIPNGMKRYWPTGNVTTDCVIIDDIDPQLMKKK